MELNQTVRIIKFTLYMHILSIPYTHKQYFSNDQ